MFDRYYRFVMDPSENPLKDLRPAQKFQVMTYLSLMWTGIFTGATGAYVWYDELLIGHALILLGIFSTTYVFRRAQLAQLHSVVKTHRDFPRTDGSARYDDLWGSN